MRNARPNRGFTLLEVIIAMAILATSLLAIFRLNSVSITSHVYTKKLTVATLLARSKMTDIEQKLYDEGFAIDDDEDSGDFSAEGWPSYKWRARILAPKTGNVSPDQLLTSLFGIPMGGEDGEDGLSALFGAATKGKDDKGGPTADPMGGMAGMAAGMMQGQLTQMLDQVGKAVREVHLTVVWKEGSQNETLDLVTHVVSMGPGGDRNGNPLNNAAQASGGGWVDTVTGEPVAAPVPGPGGGMVNPRTQNPVRAGAGTGAPGGLPNPFGQQPNRPGMPGSGFPGGGFPGAQGFQGFGRPGGAPGGIPGSRGSVR